MGSPEFAVESLRGIHTSRHEVIAVVTATDKPAGRGRKLHESDVKIYARENNLPLYQPANLKDESFINALQRLHADLFVVVAFRMLPEIVWRIPRLGTINLHASLLPAYRGAAPINHAIINGETTTGVTTFFINREIDRGDLLLQEKVPIDKNDNAGTLHDKLMTKGAFLLLKTIDGLASGNLKASPQKAIPDTEAKSAPKIFPADCMLSWEQPVETLYNKVRGLSPYPAAKCTATTEGRNGIAVKILEADVYDGTIKGNPGSVHGLPDGKIIVACGAGGLEIKRIQWEGKKAMSAADFLRGFQNSFTFETHQET